MSVGEVLVLAAGAALLVASVVAVIVRRRAELNADRSTAEVLQRMATAVDTLNLELRARHSDAGARAVPARAVHFDVLADRKVELLGLGHRGYYSMDLPQVSDIHRVSALVDVIELWDHYAAATREDFSYREILGPGFDDAISHAAKVGVVDRDQAEALMSWAQTTAAVKRTRTGRVALARRPVAQA